MAHRNLVSRHITASIKSFDSIPGPKSLPFIGTLWLYAPVIGKYKFDRLHRNGFLKYEEFGSLVREDIMPGVSIIWVFKPDDIEMVYRSEGLYPQRRSHLAIEKYRLDRPDIYCSGGLLPTNGPKWDRIRKIFQKDISKVKNVRVYLSKSDNMMKHFFEHYIPNVPTDLLPYLSRLYLELIGLVAFDESLNCFSESELDPNSRTSKLIAAAETINNVILKTDNGPQFWKKFNTPLYRKMSQAHMYIESIAKEFVNKKMSLKESQKNSLLELYLSNEKLDVKDVLGMTVDMLLAGIDTLAYTSSFALYHIAKNIDKQEKMFKELSPIMSINDPVTEDILDQSIYIKATIKEVFRMNPVSVGVGRIIAKDAVLSNYHIPAGTNLVTQNQISCRLPEYFPNPDTFIPERWLRINKKHNVHPYLVLPFGHGPRTCIARRLAEQNLQLLIINAVRKYKLSWVGKELDCRSIPINKPDGEVLIHFEKRSE